MNPAKALFRATPEVQQCHYVTGGDMRAHEALTRSLSAENEFVDHYRTNVTLDRVKADPALILVRKP